MSHRRQLRGSLFGILFVLSIVHASRADAPDDQYAPFVRTSTEIYDTKTRLLWDRSAVAGANFSTAQITCAMRANGPWRLPTAKEALTLIDEEPHQKYAGSRLIDLYVDRDAFGQSNATFFWTSTLPTDTSETAYALDLKNALLFATPQSQAVTARCVKAL